MAYWLDNTGRPRRTEGFQLAEETFGNLFPCQGINYFGSWARCFLGPDIGGLPELHNPPMRGIEGFDAAWTGIGRPPHTFSEDGGTGRWIKGHLINGGWGGSGYNLRNLVPLTSQANRWHAGVEQGIKQFLYYCHTYDERYPDADRWYGVHYTVARSVAPLAFRSLPGELYSYAPSHIGVAWRATILPKPRRSPDLDNAMRYALFNFRPAVELPRHFDSFRGYRSPVALIRLNESRRFAREIADWRECRNGFDMSVEIHNVIG